MEEKVDKIVEGMYILYGTGSGHLFWLKPDDKPIVEAIVKATLSIIEDGE